ncbi:hypothetical protein OC861_002413 [Tilletia horrida]|nr:hypothetical protein OC861_002413 [Tilletia horrida]
MTEDQRPARKRPRRMPSYLADLVAFPTPSASSSSSTASDLHRLAIPLDVHAPRPTGWRSLAPSSSSHMPTLSPAQRANFILAADRGPSLLAPPLSDDDDDDDDFFQVSRTKGKGKGKEVVRKRARSTKSASLAKDSSDSEVDISITKTLQNQCHSCKRYLTRRLMRCRSLKNGAVCPAYYCRRCINFEYKGSLKWDTDSRTFQCPKCLGFCKCETLGGDHLLDGRSYESTRYKNRQPSPDLLQHVFEAFSQDKSLSSSPKKSSLVRSTHTTPIKRKNFGWSRTGSKNNAIVIPDDDDPDDEFSIVATPSRAKAGAASRKRKAPSLPASLSQPLRPALASLPPRPQVPPAPTPSSQSQSRLQSPTKPLERTPTTFWRSGSEVDPAIVAAANRAAQQEALRRKTVLKIRIKRPSTGAFSAASIPPGVLKRKSLSPVTTADQSLFSNSNSTDSSSAAASPSVSSSTLLDAERNVWVKGLADMSTDDEGGFGTDGDDLRKAYYDSDWAEELRKRRSGAYPWYNSTTTTARDTEGRLPLRPVLFRNGGASDEDDLEAYAAVAHANKLSDSERQWRQFSLAIDEEDRKPIFNHALHHHMATVDSHSSISTVFGNGVIERSSHKLSSSSLETYGDAEVIAADADKDGVLAIHVGGGEAPALGGSEQWFAADQRRGEDALQQLGIGIGMGLSMSIGLSLGLTGGVGGVASDEHDDAADSPAVTEAEQLRIAADKLQEEEAAAAAAAEAGEGAEPDDEGASLLPGHLLGSSVSGAVYPAVPASAVAMFQQQEVVSTSVEGGLAMIEGTVAPAAPGLLSPVDPMTADSAVAAGAGAGAAPMPHLSPTERQSSDIIKTADPPLFDPRDGHEDAVAEEGLHRDAGDKLEDEMANRSRSASLGPSGTGMVTNGSTAEHGGVEDPSLPSAAASPDTSKLACLAESAILGQNGLGEDVDGPMALFPSAQERNDRHDVMVDEHHRTGDFF